MSFTVGERVQLTEKALIQGIGKLWPVTTGVVTALCRNPNLIVVKPDHLKSATYYCVAFWGPLQKTRLRKDRPPGMHNGAFETSAMKQHLEKLLADSGALGATSCFLSRATGSPCVSTWLSGMRKNGRPVSEAFYEGRTKSGQKIYRYWHLDFLPERNGGVKAA